MGLKKNCKEYISQINLFLHHNETQSIVGRADIAVVFSMNARTENETNGVALTCCTCIYNVKVRRTKLACSMTSIYTIQLRIIKSSSK